MSRRDDIPVAVRYFVLKRDGFTCAYCGARAPSVSLVLDHVMPVARGGRNEPDNLVTSCDRCNAGKRDSEPPCRAPVRRPPLEPVVELEWCPRCLRRWAGEEFHNAPGRLSARVRWCGNLRCDTSEVAIGGRCYHMNDLRAALLWEHSTWHEVGALPDGPSWEAMFRGLPRPLAESVIALDLDVSAAAGILDAQAVDMAKRWGCSHADAEGHLRRWRWLDVLDG